MLLIYHLVRGITTHTQKTRRALDKHAHAYSDSCIHKDTYKILIKFIV